VNTLVNKIVKMGMAAAAAAIVFGVYAPRARAACPPDCAVAVNPEKPAGMTSVTATNDNNPNGNTATIILMNGANFLSHGTHLSTGGWGWDGGYATMATDAIYTGANGKCLFVGNVYATGAGEGPSSITSFSYIHAGDIVTVGDYISAAGYSGNVAGLSLAVNGTTLYAGYTASGVIEQWTIGSGCTLAETGQTATAFGGYGGVVDNMAATSDCLIASYDDGSVGSYTVSPFSLAGQYTATGFEYYESTPTAIHISNGNVFADDSGGYGPTYDAWSIGSGCTLNDNTFSGPLSGSAFGSNSFSISPDGQHIYTVGSFSGTVTTNGISGLSVTNTSCPDYSLTGFGTEWLYPGTSGLITNAGTGGGLVVAEGTFTSAHSYIESTNADSNGCLTKGQQIQDSSPYLESLATYPGSPTN
jgi:hypothetical protein